MKITIKDHFKDLVKNLIDNLINNKKFGKKVIEDYKKVWNVPINIED